MTTMTKSFATICRINYRKIHFYSI